MIKCVPCAKPALEIVAVPLEAVTAGPRVADPSKSCTWPLAAIDEMTLAVKLKPVGSLEASLELATESFIVVATGPPPPPPLLPQPSVKLRTHTKPSAKAAR